MISGDGTVTFNEPPAGVLEISAGTVLVLDAPFPHPGTYTFKVRVDEEIESEIPITVAQNPQPQPETAERQAQWRFMPAAQDGKHILICCCFCQPPILGARGDVAVDQFL